MALLDIPPDRRAEGGNTMGVKDAFILGLLVGIIVGATLAVAYCTFV